MVNSLLSIRANIHEAKAKLSAYINAVLAGKEVIILRAGTPVARLVPYVESGSERAGGEWKGLVRIGKDFDDPLPNEIQEPFSGR